MTPAIPVSSPFSYMLNCHGFKMLPLLCVDDDSAFDGAFVVIAVFMLDDKPGAFQPAVQLLKGDKVLLAGNIMGDNLAGF